MPIQIDLFSSSFQFLFIKALPHCSGSADRGDEDIPGSNQTTDAEENYTCNTGQITRRTAVFAQTPAQNQSEG
jgi:hypothetical protein